ncbi:MAG: SDR family NAD(P)-dependent oxidoreductase [Actinobacteria bacterium]|nr:SDR family NAD(P)-dependent oxidoreductase [Actinomycetota bacterium]
MALFDGKVAIVTGAGRGLGREEALLLAKQGAAVVVNDVGGSRDGEGADKAPAQEVVDEIERAGGKAVANFDDISTWKGGESIVNQAIEELGGLDILINNAGILRDKMSFNMTEEEWDAVIQVHLKGHFCPSRFAGAYWRQKSKDSDGASVNAKIVNTSSEAGLYGNAGQLNYAAAKAGIAAMTIVLARELERFGVRANAIAPVALTRLTEDLMGGQADEKMRAALDPSNVAAGVAWLASDLSEGVNGQVLKIQGGLLQIVQGWRPISNVKSDGSWTIESIDAVKDELLAGGDPGIPPFLLAAP